MCEQQVQGDGRVAITMFGKKAGGPGILSTVAWMNHLILDGNVNLVGMPRHLNQLRMLAILLVMPLPDQW